MRKYWLAAAALALVLCSCAPAEKAPTESTAAAPPSESAQEETRVEYPYRIKPGEETFLAEPLTKEIIEKITGVSWTPNEQVPLEELSLLTLSYIGFDGEGYTGQMIVAADVADDVTAIFSELYENRYPIEKMRLIDDYGADDNAAMADNNTSAFCYREIDGTDVLSNHSFGRAVDVNPAQNPYVRGELVQPESSAEYLDRENVRQGMIVPGDACYNAFIARGWEWGGNWTGPIDYQHFEKVG